MSLIEHLVIYDNKMRNLLKTFSASSVKANDIIWGRWCLPAFNKHCNQDLKSHWANIDNSLSSTKPEHNTPTQNEKKKLFHGTTQL